LQQLFFGLLNGVVVHLHLLGEELLAPFVFVEVVPDEVQGLLAGNLYAGLAFFVVVDPELGPPAYEGAVGIDADKPRYVEALQLQVGAGEGVDDEAVGKGGV
jgi:hypothetical protein